MAKKHHRLVNEMKKAMKRDGPMTFDDLVQALRKSCPNIPKDGMVSKVRVTLIELLTKDEVVGTTLWGLPEDD